MALSLFAAECLVRDYLNGRTLPKVLHSAVVQAVEARLVGGLMPVLTETLCSEMDSEATRLHSTLHYVSPMRSEENWHAGQSKKAA